MAHTAYGGFDGTEALEYGGHDMAVLFEGHATSNNVWAGGAGASSSVLAFDRAGSGEEEEYPVAAAPRLQDLPEDLRREITSVVEGEGSAVLVDTAMSAKAGRPIPLAPGVMAANGGGGNLSWAVLGIVAASSAVTALAGGAVSPAVAFGSFLVLLGGVALVMASVRTAT